MGKLTGFLGAMEWVEARTAATRTKRRCATAWIPFSSRLDDVSEIMEHVNGSMRVRLGEGKGM